MSGQETLFVAEHPWAIPAFVAGVWVAVCYFSSAISGWNRLAERFQAEGEPYGDTRTAGPLFYSVYWRWWSHYSGIVRMTATADALHLSVIFFFRIGHPPLAIPWGEIEMRPIQRFLRSYVELTLGREERLPLRIPMRMAAKLGLQERMEAQGAGVVES